MLHNSAAVDSDPPDQGGPPSPLNVDDSDQEGPPAMVSSESSESEAAESESAESSESETAAEAYLQNEISSPGGPGEEGIRL